MGARGWDACDFIFVSGDAYADHPSFAAALISRYLESLGFRVGIIAQPDWKDIKSYQVLGRPRLAFLAGAGNMDSMVAHYTAAKKPRSDDAYSPGGVAGLRPDRALLKYVEGIRASYGDVPVIIGGIEASLRRLSHYDYWSGKVRRSALLDSKADILVYGMGEVPLGEIARRLDEGEDIKSITDVRGTCVRSHGRPGFSGGSRVLPSYDEIKGSDPASLRAYAEHFMIQRENADPKSGRVLLERCDERWVVENPPAFPLSKKEFDRVYELPFTRQAHPSYDSAGGIPALKEVSFSLVASRGCYGGCSFCAIGFHQGRAVVARSRESLVREAASLAALPDFKGYIHDVGGPTANFFGPACGRQAGGSFCPERECLSPGFCEKLKTDHGPYMETLAALRALPGVKKVFVRSGIRFDVLLRDARSGEHLEQLCAHHISGQLKVAPEHIAAPVLSAMGKGDGRAYEVFKKEYEKTNRRLGKKQYLVPYFMSGHPGSGLEEALELALYLKKGRFIPDQVQDFYPTPGTLSTVMYHTGLDPGTMTPVYVPRGAGEKSLQRALLQFNRPGFSAIVRDALKKAGREDLIRKVLES